jgi:hypothetical protein
MKELLVKQLYLNQFVVLQKGKKVVGFECPIKIYKYLAKGYEVNFTRPILEFKRPNVIKNKK